jgi:uncharacterized protein (TIGR04255 family)
VRSVTGAASPKLDLTPAPEVRLERAPLAKVISQVEFSRTPNLVADAFEEQLAARLGEFPVRRQGRSGAVNINIGPDGAHMPFGPQDSTLRLLETVDGTWRITLTETSVAVETTAYESRKDFCDRASAVLQAIAEVSAPPVVDRVGIRYVDRLTGDALGSLEDYVVAPIRSLAGQLHDGLAIEHSVTDTLIRVSDLERLHARSGLLPPNGAFDPSVQPVNETSWLLDIDVYGFGLRTEFSVDGLNDRLLKYAAYAYSFFRFAVTDKFIARFQ